MKQRQANMELFRIVLMIGIVFTHAYHWGGVQDHLVFPSAMYYVIKVLDIISIPSVNCFVMLSGYFLISARYKISRIIKLWIQVIFYSLFLYFVMCCIGTETFTPQAMALSLIPIISGKYWFATNYVALYLLFPFINIVLNRLEKRQYQVFLVINLLLFSIVGMIPGVSGFDKLGGNGLIWFFVLYSIGGYLHKYPIKISMKNRIIFFLSSVMLILVLSEAVMWFVNRLTGERLAGGRITGYTSIFMVIECVLLFSLFEKIRIEGRLARIITSISSLCFGVYLIHENPSVRNVLWNALGLGWAVDKWWLPIGMVIESIVVFIVCCCVEWIRSKAIGLVPVIFWERIDEKFYKLIKCQI